MKRGGGVHTVQSPVGSGWWNKIDGKVKSKHRIKDDVEAGRVLAGELKVEHTIHLSDGTIGEKNSYGNDPSFDESGDQPRAEYVASEDENRGAMHRVRHDRDLSPGLSFRASWSYCVAHSVAAPSGNPRRRR
jgi:hypothetical protein